MILRINDLVSTANPTPIRPAPPRVPYRGLPASLTNSFDANAEFLTALLPNSRAAVKAINAVILARESIQPCSTTATRRLYGGVGLAVDRGVMFFSGYDLVSSTAFRLQHRGPKARRAAQMVAAFRPPAKGVLRSHASLSWFYFLGALDTVVRGFRSITDVDPASFPQRITRDTATTWLEQHIPVELSCEIAELLRAVRDIRPPGRVRLNPVFGRLGNVTGSDGDWIAGDTLVELKCVTGGIKREHVAQLLCYFAFDRLAPSATRHGFSSLALCLPRQRCTITGDVDEWISAFGAPTRDIIPSFVQDWCCYP